MNRKHGEPGTYSVFAHKPDLADMDAYWSWWCVICGCEGSEWGTREGAEDELDQHLHEDDEEIEGVAEMSDESTNDAVVNIVDVMPDTIQVRADELKVGDYVHDVYGGRHKLVDVRHYTRTTRIFRDDGLPNVWLNEATVTIWRPPTG